VYKIDPAGRETVLYSFTAGADGGCDTGTPNGCYPSGGVTRDQAGNLYGTTSAGGPSGRGVVYEIDPAGQETVLYSFTGNVGVPSAVIRDSAGNLYGTTSDGGVEGCGAVYKLDPPGQFTVLYSFTGGANGAGPVSGLIRDSDGNLYGATVGGGSSTCLGGCGVVYKLDTSGHETVLYSFTGAADGANPSSGVINDPAGNLYGTTEYGGITSQCVGEFSKGCGVVYKLNATGGETVLYNFTGGADVSYPSGGLVRDSAGNLYGTSTSGGTANEGAVYEVDTAGQETLLHSFTGGTDGGYPWGGVILDPAGNLYGTTSSGGKATGGVVYELTRQ